AGGDSGTILTSTNGTSNWVRRTTGVSSAITGLVFTNAYIIAVTADGQALRSNDTVNWTKIATGSGQPLAGIAWNLNSGGTSRLAAVGENGTILTSDFASPPVPTASFAVTSQTVPENAGVVNVTVNITPPLPSGSLPVTLSFLVSKLAGPGLASTADYAISASPLKIVAGQTTANIAVTVKSDASPEPNETLTVTLDQSSNATLLKVDNTNQTFILTITDTVKPTIALTPPVQDQMLSIGKPPTFVAAATGTDPKIQWLKNAVAVVGATSLTYNIPSVTTANAGKYTVKATNAAAALGVIAATAAELSVVDTTDRIMPVLNNSSPVITAVAAGNGLTYQWFRVSPPGFPDVALSGTHYLNPTKAAVTIKLVTVSDEGEYYCKVTQAATGKTLNSGKFNVLIAAKPAVTSASDTTMPQSLPPGRVGTPYGGVNGYQIKVSTTDIHMTPTKFTAAPLPPGVKLNATTGVLSGKPTLAGDYRVVITASNAAGVSTTLPYFPVHVDNYNPKALGAFVGLFDRIGTATSLTVPADSTKALGARFDLTTVINGTFSGKVTVGTTIYPFTGFTLDTTDDLHPTGTFSVTRLGKTPITGTFTIDTATDMITNASITDGNLVDPLIKGWRAKWTAAIPTPVTGLHNFIIDPNQAPVPEGDKPEGTSYMSASVVPAGTATFNGMLADGSKVGPYTAPVGPNGELLIYQALYTNTGSFAGTGAIANDATHTVTGNVTWSRAKQADTVRNYKAGWAPFALTMMGGRYVPATGTNIVMGLTPGGANNAQLLFGGGGIEHSFINPDWTAFVVKSPALVTKPVSNPAIVALTIVNSTGAFNGTFTLQELGGSNKRPGTFQGLIIPNLSTTGNLGDGTGHGYFLLNQLPKPAASTTPATTLL
ncbi:MAG: hypothetical protein JWO89_3862, partial [Verrucomicrobiaceae bacterium]|nr:hypothetical protein [Verrucomicrobiaceae bacterium]